MRAGQARDTRTALPPLVRMLALVSLLSDVASEMIYPLLPVFLTSVLGASPAMLGLIEGAAESTAALVKLGSGWFSDRIGRYTPVVLVGYTLATITRPFIGVSQSAAQVVMLRLIDRTGKGIRGAPRDALLASAVDDSIRGRAYGFHRAADHLGAVFGPLVAWVLLQRVGLDLRTVFVLSAVPGALAVLTIALRVRDPVRAETLTPIRALDAPAGSNPGSPLGSLLGSESTPSPGDTVTSLCPLAAPEIVRAEDTRCLRTMTADCRESDWKRDHSAPTPGALSTPTPGESGDSTPTPGELPIPAESTPTLGRIAGQDRPQAAAPMPARFWAVLGVLLLFTLGNSTDAFLLLRAQQLGVPVAVLPLLWASLHVVKSASSVPGGALSDRLGRRAVLLLGWGWFALVYFGFSAAVTAWQAWALFLAYGVFFGLVEGAEKALIADLAPALRRGTAFGWYNAAIGVASLPASLLMGAVWTARGPTMAFLVGAGLALLAMVLGVFVLPRHARA